MDADAQLVEMIASVRRLENFPELVAKEAERELLAENRRTAASGADPYGKAWPLRKDHQQALQHAPGHIFVLAAGKTIRLIVRGVYAIHNGMRGESRRRVLPDPSRGIPPAMRDILYRAASRVFARETGGS